VDKIQQPQRTGGLLGVLERLVVRDAMALDGSLERCARDLELGRVVQVAGGSCRSLRCVGGSVYGS